MRRAALIGRSGGILGAVAALLGSSAALAQQSPPPPPPVDMVSSAAMLASAPKARIGNGVLRATILLPDAERGFYRGTRFDWSGVISSLTLGRQEYYGLWFDKVAPNVRDYVFHEGEVVSGPNTATLGPAEAFDPAEYPSFTQAAPGAGFLKIGVGVLRKPTDGQAYSSFRTYEFVDGGVWASRASRDRVEFTHTLSNAETGYGYVYRKTVRLVPGQPKMVMEHSLRNTGSRPIATTTFNHNFVTFGGAPTGAGLSLETAFKPQALRPARGGAARIERQKVVYTRALPDGDVYSISLGGFGPTAADNRFTLANAAGAAVTTASDTPLSSFALWSIRPTVAAEPFVTLSAEPGQTVNWTYTYTYAAPRGR